MSERRPLAALLLLAVVVAGIYGVSQKAAGDDTAFTPIDTLPAAPNANTGGSTNSVGVGVTTTVPGGGTIPTVVSGNPEWWDAFEGIVKAQNELLKNPNPAGVDTIIDPSCTCYATTKQGLQELQDKGWRVKGDTLAFENVTLVNASDGIYRLAVTFKPTGSPTVDASGKVVEAGDTKRLQPVLYVLRKLASGDWRVIDRRAYEER